MRGLKSDKLVAERLDSASHPTMGAWIEISMFTTPKADPKRRTPRWVRGLKFELIREDMERNLSHPTMGAWIEIKVEG